MSYAALGFTAVPRIGFAHHFHMDAYRQTHRRSENSLEIVYVKEGAVILQACGQQWTVQPGSVMLLFRSVPFCLFSADGQPHKHCSVQLQLEYQLTILTDDQPPGTEFDGLLVPLVLPPCSEAENIKKELYTIVSDIGISRKKREFSAALTVMGILARLDQLQRQQATVGSTASILEYKIKQYIVRHIHKDITLGDLARALEKTPNYLNSVFRASTGTSIHRYINGEKVRLIAEMMERREISFKSACESVAITDVSYGYRLFKKHMGVTLRTYLSGEYKTKE